MRSRLDERRGWLVAPGLCLALLAGLSAERYLFHLPVADPAAFHELVKSTVESVPYQIGEWLGTEETVPEAATELLRPTTILGRRYLNPRTGERAQLFLVYCRDARDLGGHYPPICYPANGWVAETETGIDRDWQIGGLPLRGREYAFRSGDVHGLSRIVVYNFILRPGGQTDRDVREMRVAAYDPRRRPFGGGQLQMVFDAHLPLAVRDRIFTEVLSGCAPALRTILFGVSR